MNSNSTPQASPILKPQNRARGLVTDSALGGDRQVTLQPLMRHLDVPILVFYNVLPNRREGG
ncbi:GSCOCG00002901001-RA-CDS, partial [Cotesia congregata]